MPLEIRELHIKVNVGGASGGGEGGSTAPAPKTSKEEGEDKDRLVAEAVDGIMKVLRDRKER